MLQKELLFFVLYFFVDRTTGIGDNQAGRVEIVGTQARGLEENCI